MYVGYYVAAELWFIVCISGGDVVLLLVPRLVPLTLLSRRGGKRKDLVGRQKGGRATGRWSNMTDLSPECSVNRRACMQRLCTLWLCLESETGVEEKRVAVTLCQKKKFSKAAVC